MKQGYLIYLVRPSPAGSWLPNSSREQGGWASHFWKPGCKTAKAGAQECTDRPNLSLGLARTWQDPPPSNENVRNSSKGLFLCCCCSTFPSWLPSARTCLRAENTPRKHWGPDSGDGRFSTHHGSCLHSESLKRSCSKLGLQVRWRSRKGRRHWNSV